MIGLEITKPKRLLAEQESLRPNYGKFIAEAPLGKAREWWSSHKMFHHRFFGRRGVQNGRLCA